MSQFSFFKKPTISTTNFSDNYLSWQFVSSGLVLSVESNTAANVVQYSFDGVNIDGDLTPGQYSAGLTFTGRYVSGVWLRLAPGASAVPVRVEAWSVS